MPAYFNISLQFLRKDIYHGFVKHFYSALDDAGLKFKSGFWGAEIDSLEDIILWNQAKLEHNYQLGFTEHYANNYKQILCSFDNFSEVRVFMMNNYPEKDSFSFEIIIPEDDVLDCEYPVIFKSDKCFMLIEAAKKLWQLPTVRAVQTGLEANSASTGLTDLFGGACPNMTPFAITEELFPFDRSECISEEIQGRKGYLFINKKFLKIM